MSTLTLAYRVVDVFTDTPLAGNPVAVFLPEKDQVASLSPQTMQALAKEVNLSESTFVLPACPPDDVTVRIFTPVNELPFAGHPTLGTAIAIAEETGAASLRMRTTRALVPFSIRGERGARSATMDQPVPTEVEFDRSAEVLRALGLSAAAVPIALYDNGPRHLFVGLPTEEDLTALRPDHRALGVFENMAVNVFAPARAGGHWRMRMFSPAYGVVEDAATGSAAGPLALHLLRHRRLDVAGGSVALRIVQGVEMGRTSVMDVELAVDESGAVARVAVTGSAVVVGRGHYTVPITAPLAT